MQHIQYIQYMQYIIAVDVGMEERVSRLERELARRQVVVVKEQEDETSTDGGIESGTEADDLSEKLN